MLGCGENEAGSTNKLCACMNIGPVPCEKKPLLFIFKLVFMSAIIYTSAVGSGLHVGCEYPVSR